MESCFDLAFKYHNTRNIFWAIRKSNSKTSHGVENNYFPILQFISQKFLVNWYFKVKTKQFPLPEIYFPSSLSGISEGFLVEE